MLHNIKMYEKECFWGGTTARGCDNPIDRNSEYAEDFRKKCVNQTMPLFLSNKGRYIWCDKPFKVDIKDGVISIETDGELEVAQAGNTLKEAYLAAMKKHFPFDGKKLPEEFFTTAQYNSWMEFTYFPTQKGLLEYAHDIIDNGFEPGIFIIDEGWHGRYGDWEFDAARFPNPKAMVDELHKLGFKVMLWVVPLVTADGYDFVMNIRPDLNKRGDAKEIFLRTKNGQPAIVNWWNGRSAILDFRKQCDADFLDRQLKHLINDYGVDGFKFDGGSVGMYHSGNVINGPVRDDHDAHAMNIAWNEFGRKYEYHEYKDTYLGAGKNCIQRLCDRGHRWENGGIDTLIPCSVMQGLMGTPFICPDMIGGGEWSHAEGKNFVIDEELFIRMAQCSALCPMMQFSWAPWRVLSEHGLKAVRNAAMLHKKFAPYIMQLVNKCETDGEPILQNLEYNCPGHGFEYVKDEFMLGKDILVCPSVVKGEREKTVVFPQGTWIDENGREYEGLTVCKVESPLEKLLWFKKKA